MMKKILCLMLCAVMLLSLGACGEDDPVEITFDADLTLDVLEELLREKGDALLATDIPENYAYVFQPVGVVPQVIYPIDEKMSFSLVPIMDGKNMLILSVKTGETATLDYVGAVDILEFIDSQKNS
jgi:hypothetical protein